MLKKDVAMNVQKFVETPTIYILAKCDDSIAQKLTFIEARNEDITDLQHPIPLDGGNYEIIFTVVTVGENPTTEPYKLKVIPSFYISYNRIYNNI